MKDIYICTIIFTHTPIVHCGKINPNLGSFLHQEPMTSPRRMIFINSFLFTSVGVAKIYLPKENCFRKQSYNSTHRRRLGPHSVEELHTNLGEIPSAPSVAPGSEWKVGSDGRRLGALGRVLQGVTGRALKKRGNSCRLASSQTPHDPLQRASREREART